VITSKYLDGLPLYRQAVLLGRFGGTELSRNTLAANVVRVGQAVQPVINLLRDALLDSFIVHGDETEVQVLKEPGRRACCQRLRPCSFPRSCLSRTSWPWFRSGWCVTEPPNSRSWTVLFRWKALRWEWCGTSAVTGTVASAGFGRPSLHWSIPRLASVSTRSVAAGGARPQPELHRQTASGNVLLQ
jgi:Transposase IS66 family